MKKILVILAVLGVLYWWFADPTISAPDHAVEFGYVVRYSGNGRGGDLLPMLVALHGNGDKAGNFYDTALDALQAPARILLLKGPLSYGTGQAWPWENDDFSRYGDAVDEAVRLLSLKYPTSGKPVLLGFSGGAMMAYYLAAVHGDTFSSIFPVSGRLTENMLADQEISPGARVYAFHGKQDNVIPFGNGQQAVQFLRSQGIPVKFTDFDGDHLGLFTTIKTDISAQIDGALYESAQQ